MCLSPWIYQTRIDRGSAFTLSRRKSNARRWTHETKMRAKQMKAKIIIATAIIGVTALAGVVYAAGEEKENEQKIALSTMPPAVQKTIQDNLGGGTITETAKETKEGKIVYQAHIKKSGGQEVEVKVAEDGKLLSVGKDDDQESKD